MGRGREAEGGSGAEGMSKQREDRKERHSVACSRSYVIFREIFGEYRNVIICCFLCTFTVSEEFPNMNTEYSLL